VDPAEAAARSLPYQVVAVAVAAEVQALLEARRLRGVLEEILQELATTKQAVVAVGKAWPVMRV
jgi:hypothetical protein